MTVRIMVGHVMDRLRELDDECVHCVVCSPPYYGLRSYSIPAQTWPDGWSGDLGLEPTPALYIEHMVAVFREVRRVLRKDGTLWLNIGDSYAGPAAAGATARPGQYVGSGGITYGGRNRNGLSAVPGAKPKDLLGIPWALAFALRDDGWWLRSEITWAKRAPMPESCTDRPTTATEKVFLLTRSARYFYDAEAVKEGAVADHGAGNTFTAYHKKIIANSPLTGGTGPQEPWNDVGGKRNMRNFWLLGPEPFPEAHFATFPTEIPRRAILAGTSERGVCPRCGAGWERVLRKGAVTSSGGPKKVYYEARMDNRELADQSVVMTAHETETIGWRPACSCDAGSAVPATVLDPFFGAGTTGLVADRLGRHCIGIELNPKYAAMAERRCREEVPLFAEIAAE